MSFTQVSLSELQCTPSTPLSFDEWGVDFEKGRGKAKAKGDCTPGKSYPCKSICLTTAKNCRNPLTGQAKNYADWLKAGGEKLEKPTKPETKAKKSKKKVKPEPPGEPTEDRIKVNRSDYKSMLKAGQEFSARFDLEGVTEPSDKEKALKVKHQKVVEQIKSYVAKGKTVPRTLVAKLNQIDRDMLAEERERSLSKFNGLIKGLKDYHKTPSEKITSAIDSIELSDKVRPETKEYLTEFYELTGLKGKKTLSKIGVDDERAYASKTRQYINAGDGAKRTIFHETGHHFEYESKPLAEAARDWIESRATSKTPQKLSALTGDRRYEANEVALPDKFINAYVGKIYGDRGSSTEVFSMGIEHFSSPEKLESLYRKDPEHLHLTLGAMLHKLDRLNADPKRVEEYKKARQAQEKQIKSITSKKAIGIIKKAKFEGGEATLPEVRTVMTSAGIKSRYVQDSLLYRLSQEDELDLDLVAEKPKGISEKEWGKGIPARYSTGKIFSIKLPEYYESLIL